MKRCSRGVLRMRTEKLRLTEQRDILKKSRGHRFRTAAERYARIQMMSGDYQIKALRATRNVSRSGYYTWARATRLPAYPSGS